MNEWKRIYGPAMSDPANLGSFAFVEIGRDPTQRTAWGGSGTSTPIDRCQCLRASGPSIQVFALGEGDVDLLSLDRPLRIRERSALQGFPDNIGQWALGEVAGRRIFGNAMAVPVLGSLLAHDLICLQDSLPQHVLTRSICQLPMAGLMQVRATAAHLQPPIAQPSCSSNPGQSQADAFADAQLESESDSSDDSVVGLPGQRAAVVTWGLNIAKHFEEGRPGRAPRPPSRLTPGDRLALAKRRRVSQASSSVGMGLGDPSAQGNRQQDPPNQVSADSHCKLAANGQELPSLAIDSQPAGLAFPQGRPDRDQPGHGAAVGQDAATSEEDTPEFSFAPLP